MLISTIFLSLLVPILALPLERRAGVISNDLVDGPCRPLTVIFARGTSEPGNIGLVVGPPLLDALSNIYGRENVAFQGVDYPASVPGYLVGGSPEGGATLADLVGIAVSKCPKTQIVLSGYSQGAQVVYIGADQLSNEEASKVNAAVLFGNPRRGQAVPKINNNNVITYCNDGDKICDGTVIVTAEHLDYAKDAPAAAEFIASRVNVPV